MTTSRKHGKPGSLEPRSPEARRRAGVAGRTARTKSRPPGPESLDISKGSGSAHEDEGAPKPVATPKPPLRAWSEGPLEGDTGEPRSLTSARTAYRAGPVTAHVDPTTLPESPAESSGLFDLVGSVARRALELALSSREPSFHAFVAAAPEVMIEDDVVRYAQRFARGRSAPPDIVYVHDFEHPAAPRPILLPAGVGPLLVEAMDTLIERLQREMPSIAHADEVKAAQTELGQQLEARNRAVITDLETTAKSLGFGIRAVQGGVQTFPILHGKPVSAEQFDVLDETTKRALGEAEGRLTSEVEGAAQRVRASSAKFEEARDEAFGNAAEQLIDLATKAVVDGFAPYGDGVVAYLERVRKALKEDWEDLLQEGESEPDDERGSRDADPEHATRLNRFRVNLLVGGDPEASPPVIYETNPTYPNLFGYLERRAKFGALLTDFTRVRAGSLHRASGGVLVVRAADLLADPIIWERMKRVLRERQIGAEDPLGPLGLYATSLRPVPVAIRVRVVLVGSADLYATLLQADGDFAALFRIKVEVEPSIPRTPERLVLLDSYLMNMAAERGWGAFDRDARARLLDLATRLAGERDRLSLSLAPLEETAAFASGLADARMVQDLREAPKEVAPEAPHPLPERKSAGSMVPPPSGVVGAEDIDVAWRERRERAGAAERHIRDLTLRGEVNLETTGFRVGVVNGLSVYSAGDVEFGQPMRITAVVALGREGLIDVEREAQLGGAIHTKGVAILRGYLSRMFGQERPLSLRAQIAFEQSYGEVDGDSASSSELFAILSALADVTIDQGVAVTGSVNQLGEIQAIGGVCAKIEGFYDLCAARGLTGHQGVLIPHANLSHLVLREDVARSIAEENFYLYAVKTVAEGIELLTGLPAGDRDTSGRFPASSMFGRVERRIIEIAERLREAEGHGHHHDGREPLDDGGASELRDGGEYRARRAGTGRIR